MVRPSCSTGSSVRSRRSAAVIGVGVDNDYGHPSPRALDLLALDGVQTVLRTDQEGDVSVGLVDGALTEATRGATAGTR